MDEEIGMPIAMDYTPPVRDFSSSKLPSSTQGDGRDQQSAQFSFIYNNSDRTLDRHNLFSLSSPPQLSGPFQQPHRARRGPDPITSPHVSTSMGTTPVSNSRALASSPQLPAAGTTASTVDVAGVKPSITYRECLKNHAASAGGHVVDGCGEFMPSGDEGTPEALKCAACQCHRNFHRKEIEGEVQHVFYCCLGYNTDKNNEPKDGFPSTHVFHHLHGHYPPSTFPPHHKFLYGPSTPSADPVPPMMMTFGGGGSAPVEFSSEDLNIFQSNGGGKMSVQTSSSKKRFRTKFTQEQKVKMMEFADKLGWRIQKHEEQEVQQFCSAVGVKRQVLKVWMHNNKQFTKKKM